MVANTSGSVEKINAGADDGSMPSAMMAGVIASPARSPDPVSPIAVHTALAPSGSSGLRYDPYTTMKVPPIESEKTACPIAATTTLASMSAMLNLRMYQSTPAIAPGNVSARATSTSSTTSSAGMMAMLAFSIPDRSPFCNTTAQLRMTAAVDIICRKNDLELNPSSGGRMAAGLITG